MMVIRPGLMHQGGPGSPSGEALIGALGEDGLSRLSGGRLTALLEKEEGLCQIGEGLLDGLGEARAEPVEVEFPGPPMGIGLGPASDDEVTLMASILLSPHPAHVCVTIAPLLNRRNASKAGVMWHV